MQKLIVLRNYLTVALVALLISCGTDNDENPAAQIESRLTGADLQFTRSAGDIRGLFNAGGINLQNDLIEYDVETWKIEYTTTYKGEEITASGLVFIPVDVPVSGFFSFQHGTIASNAEAPTSLALSNTQILLYSGLAGTGIVTVVPDFIGFGASSDITHPYYVEKPSADAVLDNLRAAAQLAQQSGIEIRPDLYLAGYSQGGYVTMAAHKAIQEQGIEFFDLKASFPASGGYDILGVRDFFFSQEEYQQPFFLAYVAEAYRTYYDEDQSFLELFFQDPYPSQIPGFFNGSLSGSEINNFLTTTIADLVNPDYLADTNDPQFATLNEKMEENSMIDWTPTIPMYLYHGDADVTVPYQNSVTSYDQFIENGIDQSVVTFTTLEGGTHASGVLPYIQSFSAEMNRLRGLSN
jgi:pimeloyl-ACP methyl ester carboxylesterase